MPLSHSGDTGSNPVQATEGDEMSTQSDMILEEALSMAALMLGVLSNKFIPAPVETAIRRMHKNIIDVRGEYGGLRSSQIVAMVVVLYEMGVLKDDQ